MGQQATLFVDSTSFTGNDFFYRSYITCLPGIQGTQNIQIHLSTLLQWHRAPHFMCKNVLPSKVIVIKPNATLHFSDYLVIQDVR